MLVAHEHALKGGGLGRPGRASGESALDAGVMARNTTPSSPWRGRQGGEGGLAIRAYTLAQADRRRTGVRSPRGLGHWPPRFDD